MVDDFGVSRSSTESTVPPTFSGHIGWVEFEESDKESKCINCTAEEKVSAGNGQYISRLGEFINLFSFEYPVQFELISKNLWAK